jgi:NADH-quinone oxidoreductase subunit N
MLGIGSLFIGAFGALAQKDIKRFLAYASVSQMGVFLLGTSTHSFLGLKSSFLHLLVYIVSSVAFFGLVINTTSLVTGRNLYYISDFAGLSLYNKNLSNALLISLFSMAGVPPLSGFFTKMLIFCNLSQVDFLFTDTLQFSLFSIISMLVLSLVTTFYYIEVIKQIFFETPRSNAFF